MGEITIRQPQARRSSGLAKEGNQGGFRRTYRSAAGDGAGLRDRVRVLGWKQDAHSVEEYLRTRLGKPASRLAGSGTMIHITAQMRVLVAIEPVDGRKRIDSLVRVCEAQLGEDPFSGCVFFFRNRSAKSILILAYDGQGYWLAQKRLSQGRFTWWPESSSAFYHARESLNVSVSQCPDWEVRQIARSCCIKIINYLDTVSAAPAVHLTLSLPCIY
jgi:transposase